MQPCSTPAVTTNQPDIWPSTQTQLTVLLYRSSRSSMIFDGTPFFHSSSHSDSLFTESKAAQKSAYAIQDGCLNSCLGCNLIILSVAMRSVVERWDVNPLFFAMELLKMWLDSGQKNKKECDASLVAAFISATFALTEAGWYRYSTVVRLGQLWNLPRLRGLFSH